MSEKKTHKITGAVMTAILILAVLLCTFVVTQVLTRGYVKFGPYSVFRVATGSMEPTLPVGTLLLSKEVDISVVQTGDIVCFRSTVMGRSGQIVTHRVIQVGQDLNGGVLLETKGDANLTADGDYVTQANFVGEVVWHSGEGNPLTDILSFLSSATGFLLCIALPCLLIVGMILKSCVGNIKADLAQAMDELAAQEAKNQAPAEEAPEQMEERIRRELMQELGLDPAQKEQVNETEPAEEMRQGAKE